MQFDHIFTDNDDLSDAGKLTLGKALIGKFYRLLEGTHANKVVVKSNDRIDGE